MKWFQNTTRCTFNLLMCIWIVGGRGSSNRNASRDESVETGDESIEAREKHNNRVIIKQHAYISNFGLFSNAQYISCEGQLHIWHYWIWNSISRFSVAGFCDVINLNVIRYPAINYIHFCKQFLINECFNFVNTSCKWSSNWAYNYEQIQGSIWRTIFP